MDIHVLLRPGMLRRGDFEQWLPEPYIPPEPENEDEIETGSIDTGDGEGIVGIDLTFDSQKPKAKTNARTKAKTKAKSGTPGSKKCTKCKKTYSLKDFRPHDTTADGYAAYCRFCQNELNKKYRYNNIPMRIKHHFATRVKDQLSLRNCIVPEGYTEDLEAYFGYTMKQLFDALNKRVLKEYQITAEVAIRSGWHIDHIKPLMSFDVKKIGDQAFKDCWAISNLRIIPKAENLAKGATDAS